MVLAYLGWNFFGIGCSITKNTYLSNIHKETKVNHLQNSKEFSGPKNTFAKGTNENPSIRNKNHPAKDKEMKKNNIFTFK